METQEKQVSNVVQIPATSVTPPRPRHRWVYVLVGLVMVFGGLGLLTFTNKDARDFLAFNVGLEPVFTLIWPDEFPVTTKEFSDAELGVTFYYPSVWGEAVMTTTANSSGLTKKITFTKEANLYFETKSPALFSNANDLHIPPEFAIDITTYCKENLRYNRSEPLTEDQDMYRLNSEDEFGICQNPEDVADVIVYRTEKTISSSTQQALREQSQTVSKAEIQGVHGVSHLTFSKRYYITTENPLYGPLTLYQNSQVEIPSPHFCYSPWATNEDGSIFNYLINFNCISYKDKPLIELGFEAVEVSNLNQNIALLLRTMRLDPIEHAQALYLDNFKELVTIEADHFTYQYPKILVANYGDDRPFSAVTATTREAFEAENAQLMQEYETCNDNGGMHCQPPVDNALWDKTQRLLESNPADGPVVCLEDAYSYGWPRLCEIQTHGNNTFFTLYGYANHGESVVYRARTIYKDNLRIHVQSPGFFWPRKRDKDPLEYKDIENHLLQKLYDDIAASLVIR